MATKPKLEVVQTDTPDNMRIWSRVDRTDPAHTKKVNQRGGFTAISAHYQVMRATETFGPVGEGWGYDAGEPMFHDTLVFVPVTIWHGERGNRFGPLYGGAEWKSGTRMDSDAIKKAATDGLTKGLSQLGFNADVFLGRFDDNKYIEQMTAEFAEPVVTETKPEPVVTKTKPEPKHHNLKTALRNVVRELESCGDIEQLEAYLADPETVATLREGEEKVPEWLVTGEGMPAEFVPLLDRIAKMRTDFEAAANQGWRENVTDAG